MTAPVLDGATTAPVGTAVREKGRVRSALGWILIAVLVVVFALFIMTITAETPDSRGSLDPESAKGSGAQALAEILRDQGVEVTVARTRVDAIAAASDGATLVMADPTTLTDEGVESLLDPADDVVVLSSSTRMLRLLDIGENAAWTTGSALSADCDAGEFANVGTVRPERFFSPADGVIGCFVDDAGAAAVLIDERGDGRTVLVEGSDLFSNAHLAEDGNAALGLALLGQNDRIVWYVPSLADTDIEAAGDATLAELTPPWVTPAILLLLLAGVVAAVARGQRFGPLVAETLPVTVRASETMHGRARLTARAGDAAHAAAALRDGSLRRLARRLGLTARSTPVEIADAAADRLRVPRGSLHALLDGPLPQDDARLVDTARRLAELEAAVDAAVHVERNTP